MALQRILSFVERERILRSLLAINSNALVIQTSKEDDGCSPDECYTAVREVLADGEALAANLTWYPEYKATVDATRGITRFKILVSGGNMKVYAVPVSGGGTAGIYGTLFDVISSGDEILIKNADVAAVNGKRLAVSTSYGRVLTLVDAGGALTSSYHDNIEIILYQKDV